MTRILRSARVAVAAVAACIVFGSVTAAGTGPAGANPSVSGTALPAGWELCILQGLGAPTTQANVADLDEWQVAEGGSTNNSAAFNPFNTGRTTDVNNAPLPETISSNGFPAFANWLAGCSATIATLVQPNMWSITAALRSGNVSPPSAFLAAVDQSQWCAPTNGVPCYANAIMGSASQLVPALLTDSSALQVYGNVQTDVHAYQLSVVAVAADQGNVAASNQELLAAEAADAVAKSNHATAEQALQKFAIDEYVSSGLYVTSLTSTPNAMSPDGGQSPDGVLAQEYTKIAAGDLVAKTHAAEAALKAAQAARTEAFKGVAKANAALAADNETETRSLVRLVSDLATMQRAGACTTVVLTASIPAAPASGAQGTMPAGTPGTATTPSPTVSTTTTTATTVPPTTTTTTTPPTTTTTTLLSPSVPSGGLVPTTTTTTTAAPTTTTSTVAPTTTTTAPAPIAPSGATPAAPETASPAALGQLQGCMATFAPSTSA